MQHVAPGDGVSPRKAVAVTLSVAAIVALALLFWELAPILLLAFGGVLVAIFFHSLASWVVKLTGFSSGWSLAIVLLLFGALLITTLYISGEPIATQMTELADQIPRSLEKIRGDLKQYKWGEWLIEKAPESPEELPISGKDVASYASTALSTLTGGFAAGLIVLFLALYIAFDPDTYVRGAIRLLPVRKRKRVRAVLTEVHDALQWWLLGKIFAMILVGVLTSIGLSLIGVPLALALGVVSALLTFVPNFGPILSAIPAVLLAFVDSPMLALYVVILYLAIQTVESYFITPLIEQQTISLPPALTISTQVGLGILFGVGGVVLATPLTAGAMVLVKRLYVEDVLEVEVT